MSLELDWSLLADDVSIATHFKAILNRALSSAKTPDFIGPIEITNLDLGHQGLDIEVTKIGDLWNEFVEIDAPPNAGRERERDRDGRDSSQRHHQSQSQSQQQQQHPQDSIHSQRRKSKKNLKAKEKTGRAVDGTRDHVGGDMDLRNRGQGQGADRFMHRHLPVPQTNRLQTLRQYDSEVDAQMISGGTVTGPGSGSSHQNQNYRPWSAGLGTSSYSAATPWSQRGGGGQYGYFGAGVTGISTPMSNGKGGYFSHWQPQPPPPAPGTRQGSFAASRSNHLNSPPIDWGKSNHDDSSSSSSNTIPDLQIHASLTWPTTSLRLTISTSLLINYPSPMFMSLPLQITATGFILQAGLILALEGEKRRIHISLQPDEDDGQLQTQNQAQRPTGLEANTNTSEDGGRLTTQHLGNNADFANVAQSSKPSPSLSGSAADRTTETPFKNDPQSGASEKASIPSRVRDSATYQPSGTPGLYSRQNSNFAVYGAGNVNPSNEVNRTQHHSIGARLLPSMTFESSVGQADKHTLRNVGKVEKFILDLVRKGIEDEVSPDRPEQKFHQET